jgi:polysaccharide deacetylase 2 family uncharacterized protein YibQ
MSRFQGYVGLANLMGARFTASEQALSPVLREAAKRGLLYFDDGSSQRSVASQVAGANNLVFAKADVVIDQLPTIADVERALGRLETIARERGVAVGFAGALPAAIERIAKWAKAAHASCWCRSARWRTKSSRANLLSSGATEHSKADPGPISPLHLRC